MLCTEHMASVGEQQQRGDHLTMTLVVRVSIYSIYSIYLSIVSTVSTHATSPAPLYSRTLPALHRTFLPPPPPHWTMCHMCIPHCHCHCPALHNTLKLKYFNTIPSQNHLSLPVLVLCMYKG